MLHYVLIFFIAGLVAVFSGFSEPAAATFSLRYVLAMFFIALAGLALIAGLLRKR